MSQPPPLPGREDVTEALVARLRRRQAKGRETYGTSLQTFNGRSALTDALEEALDLARYLERELLERAELERRLRTAEKALGYAQRGLRAVAGGSEDAVSRACAESALWLMEHQAEMDLWPDNGKRPVRQEQG